MFNTLLRKSRLIAQEPVLRKWLIGRLLGKYPAKPSFQANRPAYAEQRFPIGTTNPNSNLGELAPGAPKNPLELPLAGQSITLQPGQHSKLFQRSFEDTETLLSLHRFAWLPLLGDKLEPAWVGAIWSAWMNAYQTVDKSWSWHPYTAAERAINILWFATRHGLPAPVEETLHVLAAHGPAIANNLEYFGDHHTSNHLANNGRGLFILGLMLGLPDCANLGATILIAEAKRIFGPSGILREGSSHYHLLLAHNYRIAMIKAEEYEHPAFAELSDIVKHIYSPLSYLKLPGGMPLIGDISPDLPPAKLEREFDHDIGAKLYDPSALINEGWLRYDSNPWSGLWHVSPGGWSHMPGHGHQDCGSFEVHYNNTPIFIDPGRGSYGEEGDAAYYRSAAVHNSVMVDGVDPYPSNKPYYDDAFRLRTAGPPPDLKLTKNGVSLTHNGFSRLKSLGSYRRIWSFKGNTMSVLDRIDGSGNHSITRTLCTTLAIEKASDGLILNGDGLSFWLRIDGGELELENGVRWTAYGEGQPATFIRLERRYDLPWQGYFTLDKIDA